MLNSYPAPQRILWIFNRWQPLYDELRQEEQSDNDTFDEDSDEDGNNEDDDDGFIPLVNEVWEENHSTFDKKV